MWRESIRITLNYIKAVFVSLITIFLVACGDESSSSGTGTTPQAIATPAPTPTQAPDPVSVPESIEGIYIGVWRSMTTNPFDPTFQPLTDAIDLTITITGEQVEIRDINESFVATGTLNTIDRYRAISMQTSFRVRDPEIDDLFCSGEFIFLGLVTGEVTQGDANIELTCRASCISCNGIKRVSSGPFRATRD